MPNQHSALARQIERLRCQLRSGTTRGRKPRPLTEAQRSELQSRIAQLEAQREEHRDRQHAEVLVHTSRVRDDILAHASSIRDEILVNTSAIKDEILAALRETPPVAADAGRAAVDGQSVALGRRVVKTKPPQVHSRADILAGRARHTWLLYERHEDDHWDRVEVERVLEWPLSTFQFHRQLQHETDVGSLRSLYARGLSRPRLLDVYITEMGKYDGKKLDTDVYIKGGVAIFCQGRRRSYASRSGCPGLALKYLWEGVVVAPSTTGGAFTHANAPPCKCADTTPEGEWKRLMGPGEPTPSRESWPLARAPEVYDNIFWVLSTSPMSTLRGHSLDFIERIGRVAAEQQPAVLKRPASAIKPEIACPSTERPASAIKLEIASPSTERPASAINPQSQRILELETPEWLRLTAQPSGYPAPQMSPAL